MQIQVQLARPENLDHYQLPLGATVTLDLEAYLLGVVPSEVGNAPLEACKAQAIAARTYALPYALKGHAIPDSAATAQAYRAPRAEDSAYANAHRGVRETAGLVLCHEGKPLSDSIYSHSNGGRTISSKARWGGERPYLIEQQDPWDRAATGGAKKGHGVGMSQSGAIYAAKTLGETYRTILRFYYPGTEIRDRYGQGKVV